VIAAEFNWWLLIVGLAVGAGLTWLVLADSRRREEDAVESELPIEAEWIRANLASAGLPSDDPTIMETLRLHRAWLASPPPEDEPESEEPQPAEPQPGEPEVAQPEEAQPADARRAKAARADG
jgi:hypothetical protein